MAFNPLNTGYDPNKIYDQQIRDLISNKGSIDDVATALQERNNKALGMSGLGKYANDAFTNQALNYIGSGGTNIGDLLRQITNTPQDDMIGGGGGGEGIVATDSDIQSKIDQLISTQRASKIAGLTSARDSALSGLSSVGTEIEDTAWGDKNRAAAQSDVGAYNFSQKSAAMGIKGNAAMQPEIYRNAALQSTLGNIDVSKSKALTDLENQRAAIERAYNSDVLAANSDMDSQQLQLQIDLLQQAKQQALQTASTNKTDWTNTTGQFYPDIQAEIDRVQGLINQGQTVDERGVSLQYQLDVLSSLRVQKILDQQAAAAKQSSGGGGGGSGPASTNGGDIFSAISQSGIDPYTFLAVYGSKYGVSSSEISGVLDGYDAWKTTGSTGGGSTTQTYGGYGAVKQSIGNILSWGGLNAQTIPTIIGELDKAEAAGTITNAEKQQMMKEFGLS